MRHHRTTDSLAASDATGPVLPTATVLREYFPLSLDGQLVGIVGVWRDAVPILAQLDDVRRNIVITHQSLPSLVEGAPAAAATAAPRSG